jgi:hypothetical protein
MSDFIRVGSHRAVRKSIIRDVWFSENEDGLGPCIVIELENDKLNDVIISDASGFGDINIKTFNAFVDELNKRVSISNLPRFAIG